MRSIGFFIALVAIFGASIGSAGTAEAQSSVFGGGSSLIASPHYPEPNQSVRLELNDFSLNTQGASYRWFVNGSEVTAAKNQRTFTTTVGELGTKTVVEVRTTLANGASVPATITLTPIRIDMLIEADTRTPSFYIGRALPSSGSLTRVTVLPFTSSGNQPGAYSYIWRVGETVVDGGSRVGKNSVTFRSGFERNVEVGVDILDGTGQLVATKTIFVPMSDVVLHFYQIDPLQGVIERAFSKQHIFVGDEMRVRAEPYYLDTTLAANNRFTEWKLNGARIENPSEDAQEIVLRKTGVRGSFNLEFHIRNLRQLLQGVKDSVTLTF